MNETRQEEALRSQKGALTHHCWPSETAAVLDSFYWSLVITIWALSSCHPIWTKWKEVVQLVRWICEWSHRHACPPPSSTTHYEQKAVSHINSVFLTADSTTKWYFQRKQQLTAVIRVWGLLCAKKAFVRLSLPISHLMSQRTSKILHRKRSRVVRRGNFFYFYSLKTKYWERLFMLGIRKEKKERSDQCVKLGIPQRCSQV